MTPSATSGKSDRAFLIGALGLGLGLALGLAEPAGGWLTGLLALVAVLLLVTIVRHVRRGLEEIRTRP